MSVKVQQNKRTIIENNNILKRCTEYSQCIVYHNILMYGKKLIVILWRYFACYCSIVYASYWLTNYSILMINYVEHRQK